MSMTMMKCPSCGADLEIDDSRSECFCTYCGSKILITNDNEYTVNINQVNRVIDDAEVIRAKTESAIVQNRIETEKNKFKLNKKGLIILNIIGAICLIFTRVAEHYNVLFNTVGPLLGMAIVFLPFFTIMFDFMYLLELLTPNHKK